MVRLERPLDNSLIEISIINVDIVFSSQSYEKDSKPSMVLELSKFLSLITGGALSS